MNYFAYETAAPTLENAVVMDCFKPYTKDRLRPVLSRWHSE